MASAGSNFLLMRVDKSPGCVNPAGVVLFTSQFVDSIFQRLNFMVCSVRGAPGNAIELEGDKSVAVETDKARNANAGALEHFPCCRESGNGRAAAFSLGKTPIKIEAPLYTYRENALGA